MMEDKSEIELINEALSRPRKYAKFFEWTDKGVKERGIVKCFINSIKCIQKGLIFNNLESAPEDPPDCIAKDGNGNLIGFEVTELVDRKILYENIKIEKENDEKNIEDQMPGIYRDWSGEEVVKELERILAEKDSKPFKDGPYNKLILIVHNDELGLILEEVKKALENHEFKQTSQIDEAYLLLSYHPYHEPSYPLIPMKIKKVKAV